MSSVNIGVKTLLSDAAVIAIVKDRIYPITVPQNAKAPYIVVHLISEPEEDLLSGSSQLRDGRISIESVAEDVPTLSTLGEAAIDAMRDRIEFPIAGCIVTTRKAGTDETDHGDQTAATGYPVFVRRITDWYVFWRR